MFTSRCPYWRECQNYDNLANICECNAGYYGQNFKADSCFKRKEDVDGD